MIKMFQPFCCNSVFCVLFYITHSRWEKGKKQKKQTRPTSCKHSEKQAECKTTNRTLCGLRSGAVLREPLPLQKDRQKWRKSVASFFLHVRGAERTLPQVGTRSRVQRHLRNHSRVWPEGGFISNINWNWTKPRLACTEGNISWTASTWFGPFCFGEPKAEDRRERSPNQQHNKFHYLNLWRGKNALF